MMAILNVTPDSFSDGGKLSERQQILEAAGQALAAGAHILDIGGESTRPGAKTVDPKEEADRVIPAIQAILETYPQTRISVDTRKAVVAEAALQAGAVMVNDVSGLQYDPAMAEVCARYACELVIMHSQGEPETMQRNPQYPNGVIPEITAFFERQIQTALAAGLPRHQIILDPGFGFGKTLSHNLELLTRLREFQPLGLPILAGTSRKSFLTLGESGILPAEREALTAASLAMAIQNGASYVRVHSPILQTPVIRFLEAARDAAG